MAWWRKNWRWLLAVGISVLGLIVVVLLYVLTKRREAEHLRAQLALMKAGAQVEGLQAQRKVIVKQLGDNAVATKKLDVEITEAKRKAVATVKAVDTMSDEQVADEFRGLGY